jgi:hypothetical protein
LPALVALHRLVSAQSRSGGAKRHKQQPISGGAHFRDDFSNIR